MKIRVYELAKELNLSSKELIEILNELGIEITSHMSTISKDDSNAVKSLLADDENDKDKKEIEVKEETKEKIAEETEEKIEELIEDEEDILYIGEEIVVKDLADLIGVTPASLISKLIGLGVMVSQNQSIDSDIAIILGEEYGKKLKVQLVSNEKEEIDNEFNLDYEDNPKDLEPRAPVVTVMGHVDHGKTSLLDAIKESNVTKSEAGGITQHIGAYSVKVNNKKITFLDTPGHEAFTSMRARGAQITDIAILVVAADDGVMPQTIEAINHAKAAKVPIIVAINKMDKPDANVDRIKQELMEHGLMPEDWGGDIITVPISALKREGIDELLEMILLVSEMQELKANPNRPAVGTIIEAELDKGKGPLATVLVQKGSLSVGDNVASGVAYGRVRAMFNDRGESIDHAGPSTPVVILGLSDVPNSGDNIYSFKDDKTARIYAGKVKDQIKEDALKSTKQVSLDDLFDRIAQGDLKELNIIIKADVRGSIEALKQSLEKLSTEEVKTNVVHGGVGGITESDILLATASNAIVIGFNVRPNLNAIENAKKENIDIRTYRVIYEAIEDIKNAIKGMHAPKIKEEIIGRAEVRALFRLPNNTTAAGIYVQDGKILRNGEIRLIRDDVVIFEGKISSLRRVKDDVREVQAGYEAGIGLENYNDIKENDILEAFLLKEIQN